MNYHQFEQRKRDHIQLALQEKNQAIECHDLDYIQLHHQALPDINFDQLKLEAQRLGQPVEKPFYVSSMTAGHEHAFKINDHLLAACAVQGWAMGVGSQRRELSDASAKSEWNALRQKYPQVEIFGNIGIAQIIHTPVSQLAALVDNLNAQALIVHCNPLQECIQPEGTTNFSGCWQALEKLIQQLNCPVIVKETGCGFSPQTLSRLDQMGVGAIDISGLGGTHWGRIEGGRADKDSMHARAAETFKNWGTTTAQCLIEAQALNMGCELWGSGGVRSGLDAAKLIALGASSVGFAKLMLEAALQSPDAVISQMQHIEFELKVAMFCTGSPNLLQLRNALWL